MPFQRINLIPRHHFSIAAVAAVCGLLLALALGLPAPLTAQSMAHALSQRTLTGTVTDTHREPVPGAIVQLQKGDSPEVITYLTDASGRYDFKRLDGSHDYQVWAVLRSRHTKKRSISKFDSHENKVINFTVKTY